VWSVDFGYSNPFVCQMWAEDPDGRLILYREIYHTKKTVDVHAADILATVSKLDPRYIHPSNEKRFAHHGRTWYEPKPRSIICDHDSENREVLARELGIGTTAAHKSVDTGIEAVNMRMVVAGDGRPRLLIMRDCVVRRDPDLVEAKKPTCTAEEIPGYVWLKRKIGTDPSTTEEPLKKDDHGCDAMRYRVADADLAARPRVRLM
jgi:phage terminase large subunit